VIAYFDTSAIIPLIIKEPSSDDASRTISTRLIYPEARAALAQAERIGRLTAASLAEAVKGLDSIATEINYLEITEQIAESAGTLARAHALRGYDAVHLASAELANDDDFVFVTGDRSLGSAAETIGISTALTAN